MRRLVLSLLLSVSPAVLLSAAAQDATPPAATPAQAPSAQAPGTQVPSIRAVPQLDATTVTATREERPIIDVPASVTIIDGGELERRDVHTIRDAVRYEPGISTGNQPNRGGTTSYNIRGIGENRVRIMIDGVRVPDFPGSNIGAGTYNRDFVDLDILRRIEIVRGPASALYGSDAIGGVVAYVTREPSEYLNQVGRDWYVGGRTGWDSTDQSFGQTVIGAARRGAFELLTMYSHRSGHEVQPNDPRTGTITNPQDYTRNNVLAKLVWNPTTIDRVRLITEYFGNDTDTALFTDLGQVTASTRVIGSNGTDQTQRIRVSLDHVHDGRFLFADRIESRLYYTNLQRRELTDQQRVQSGTLRLRHSDFFFEQDIIGGEIQLTNRFALWSGEHSLIYGASLDYTLTTRPRSRYEINTVTGAVITSFSGGPGVPAEAFPNKLFPDTRTFQAGFYVQDEIRVGRVTFWPGVRFDYYNLDPQPDSDFQRGNTSNFQVAAVSATAVSPKFGITWRVTDQMTVFGQYARGFRAPPYDDANIGFVNGPQRYAILPNPNLQPEYSNSYEAGIRYRPNRRISLSGSVFRNDYEDFIDTVVVGTAPGGITLFQPQNITRATIWGFEGRAEYRFAEEWSLYGAFAYAHGTNEQTESPLDSVAPFTVVGALAYDHRSGMYGARVSGLAATRHNRTSNPTLFQAPAYGVVDLLAYFEPTPRFRISAGINNLLDKKYFNYLDVTGIAANNVQIDRYAAPGRAFFVTAALRW